MAEFKQLSKNAYVLSNAKIDTSLYVNFGTAIDASYSQTTAKNGEFVPWGEKDAVLLVLHKLASESPNKWRLLKTRRDFILGGGIDVVTRIIKDGKKTYEIIQDDATLKMYDWLEANNYGKLLSAKAMDYCFSGRYFVKITNILGGGVRLDRIDVFHCRPAKMDVGESKINKYILNGNFGTKNFKKNESIEIPAFDFNDPLKYAVSILDVKEDLTGQVYHSFSEWWGTTTWTEVANEVPKFHRSGLKNGYNVKYHISFPDDYFQKEEYEEGFDEVKLKEKVLKEMNDALSGVENADKTLVTFHKLLSEGRYAESGVKITALKNEMSDDAYTTLFNTADRVQASGHGVGAVLAGIDTGGKLGGSGKELEASANYHQGFLTYADRQLMLEDLNIVKKILGWPKDKYFRFENIQLYTYDVTPAGASSNPNKDGSID